MGDTPTSESEITIDLSDPWIVPARLQRALESFDRLVAQIEGAVPDDTAGQALDWDEAA